MVVLLAALAVVLAVRRSSYLGTEAGGTRRGVIAADGWGRLTGSGWASGPDSARVVILVFGDYRCQHCRTLNLRIDSLLAEHPSDIRFVFRHWPLERHPQAYAAAHAAVCAGEQGRFWEMHRLLFAKQDSLVHLSLAELGRRVRIPDREALGHCSASAGPMSRISADIEEAVRLGALGVPALWVNGRETAPGMLRRAVAIGLGAQVTGGS
jgi:protein-disulfide isomerase